MRRYGSFFWPALLILVGIVALLVNTGVISTDRLYQLVLLWPVILIVVGLEIIVRRSMRGAAGDAATAAILVVAVVGAVAYVAAAPAPKTSGTLDASGQLGDLQQASVEINTSAATINVTSSSDLGANLYQAHIEYSGNKPEVDLDRTDGSLRITQRGPGFFEPQRFTLTLKLNQNAHLRGITVNSGASQDNFTLGPPTGIVPVKVNGGAVTVHVHRPKGVPASIEVSGGAVSLDADGRHSGGVGDLSYESSNFSGASDAYRVSVNCGSCSVTLDSTT